MRSDESLLETVLRTLARQKTTRGGVVLWSVVGRLFGLGSTSATELCQRFGLDPCLKVKSRIEW
jgi:hypothetical protein